MVVTTTTTNQGVRPKMLEQLMHEAQMMKQLLSGKCNDPGSARELTHINPSRL
jgi:hypothetical protein